MDEITLKPVECFPLNGDHIRLLYELLKERDDTVNISHKKMPTYLEHADFVRNNPYKKWLIINYKMIDVGSVYVTNNNEIGIFILKSFRNIGIGRRVIKIITENGGSFFANINPRNEQSIKLFESLGFKHIQNTYKFESE